METSLKGQDYKGLSEKLVEMNTRQVRIEQKIEELSNSINKIEDMNRWVWRTILGAMLVGALAIVFGI